MPEATAYPSPFYALFDNGVQYELCFPCDEDGGGPYFHADGSIDADRCKEQSCEPVVAVPLGDGRYRLAERCAGPFSGLSINWGDEFVGTEIEAGQILFEQLVLPRRFAHWHLIGSSGFSNTSPFAELLHRFGRGWESIAGGMMTFTAPSDCILEITAEAERLGILPRGLTL